MGDRVKFICKRTVVSTKPVERGKSYRLSVFDHVMEPNHIRLVYYYQCPKNREPGETTKKLRESLAETITHFPIMTGRLVKDDGDNGRDGDSNGGGDGRPWRVKCNDAGVRMVEATAEGSVEEWLRSVDREEELRLVHWEDMYRTPYFWSTFYVQLTEFEDGGLAIGLSCTHLLADPISAAMFIRAWADTTLARTMSAPPLFHQLPTRRPGNTNPARKPDYAHLINHYSKSFTGKSSPSCVNTTNQVATVSLVFTDPVVRAHMGLARSDEGDYGPAVSPFEVLAGLFWACVSRAQGMRDGLIDMSIGFDMRKVLHLDQGYFGNCMVYGKVERNESLLSSDETEDNKLSHAIEEIRKATKGMMDYDGVMDLIEWLRSKDHAQPLINGSDLTCINLESINDSRLIMFEEECIPNRISCYIEGTLGGVRQVITLPSPPCEGPMSRIVVVTLPEKEMVEVMEDEFFQSLFPIMLMGIKNNN